MAVGDAQAEFQAAASADGVTLNRAKVAWINQRGHFGLPAQTAHARLILDIIFRELGGEPEVQSAKRPSALPGDFYHAASGNFIETDELQHFTSFRLRTLTLYPSGVPLGFDMAAYLDLCRQWAPKADKYRAAKAAVGFGPGGRRRQRAYYDALRDLAIPLMGHGPLIRVPIIDGDGRGAWVKHREVILGALLV